MAFVGSTQDFCVPLIDIGGTCGPTVRDQGDGCVKGAYCNPTTSVCEAANLEPGAPCPTPLTPDRDPCRATSTCVNGQCSPYTAPPCDLSCSAGSRCTLSAGSCH